jgi:hypothetical protein
MSSQSKYEVWKEASLSQKLSDKIPILAKLSGTDKEISDAIAVLTYINDPENRKKSGIDFMLGLLDVLRLSHFATSERNNEITKMGLMMPKSEDEISTF